MNSFIEAITNFIFHSDYLEKSDIILIPGASYFELPEKAADLYHNGYAPIIMVSGLYSSRREYFPYEHIEDTEYEGYYCSESDFMKSVLIKKGVPKDHILSENESRNSLENAQMTKAVIEANGLKINNSKHW